MISVQYIAVLTFLGLFVSCIAQYYRYPSNPYNYGNMRTYPVSNQNYIYRQQPCRSSCNSYCQHLPCSNNYNNYMSQAYLPYAYQNRRNSYPYAYPYFNFYSGSTKSSDPYANIPVEIIDDDSVLGQTTTNFRVNNNHQNDFANVPVEIIDDDRPGDFWKHIPVLPKTRTSSYSNYTVMQGGATTNTMTQSKPVRATITRTFQPLKTPEFKIDFFNGVPSGSGSVKVTADDGEGNSANVTAETTTVQEEENGESTETNEVTEKESEDVSPIGSWFS